MPLAKIDDGVEINYTLSGARGVSARINAATLMACSNEIFQGIMEQSRSLLTFDYRGTGKSTGPDSLESYTAGAYTEDMHQLFNGVGIEQSPIIGYSHGGFFAIDFAQQHVYVILAEEHKPILSIFNIINKFMSISISNSSTT